MFKSSLVLVVVTVLMRVTFVLGALPAMSPTFNPTLPSNTWSDIAGSWDPQMTKDPKTGLFWILFSDQELSCASSNGGLVHCTDFTQESCTTYVTNDAEFYTDSTLNTGNAKRICDSNYNFVVKDGIPYIFTNDGIYKCGAKNKCHLLLDSSAGGVMSDYELPGDTFLLKDGSYLLTQFSNQNIMKCNLETPSCTRFMDLSAISGFTDFKSCSPGKFTFSSDFASMFISCYYLQNDNYLQDDNTRGVVLKCSTTTCDNADPYISSTTVVDPDNNGDTPFQFYKDSGLYHGVMSNGLQMVTSTLYVTDPVYGRVYACKGDPSTCKMQVNKHSFNIYSDDDGNGFNHVASIKYFDGCFYYSTFAKVFQYCENGIASSLVVSSSESKASYGGMVAASVLAGFFGATTIGLLVYTFAFKPVEKKPVETVEVEEVELGRI